MIQNVIKRSDSTEVSPIREGSFSFVEQVNEEGNLRFGTVISSYIHAEVFGSASLSVGDIITYWQRTDIDYDFTPLGYNREFKIGTFIVTDVVVSKASYSFTAYDYIRKLEVDFSNQLTRLKSSFPMTMSSLITEIENYTGATIDTTNLLLLSDGYDVVIKWLYSDGITAKEVLSYIAETSGVYAKCNSTGTICFGAYDYAFVDPYPNWLNGTSVIICPTDTVTYYDSDSNELIPIWYKENGFEKADYQCAEIDAVYVKKTDGTTLFGVINSTISSANIFTISANPIIDNIDFTTGAYSEIDVFGDSTLYLENLLTQGVTPFSVKLFPFRNPFRAGDKIYYIEDTSGVRFKSLVMKMEVTDSEVTISCYGNEKYSNSEKDVSVAESVVAMSAQINDKVNKSGDTMSGLLAVQRSTGNGIAIDDMSADATVNPGSNVNLLPLVFRDKNAVNMGAVRIRRLTNGTTGLYFYGTNNGVNNALILYVDSNGNRAVSVSDNVAWQRALGLRYVSGDTLSISDLAVAGYITGGGATIIFDISTPLFLDDISNIAVTSLVGRIRGTSGYVDNETSSTNWNSSPYTATALKRGSSHIRLSVAKTSAFSNVTNNTPVSGEFTFTFTFS